MIKRRNKLFLFITLVLSFLFINSNNIKAYYNKTDTIYSNTLKFDTDDYYNINLIDYKNMNYTNNNGTHTINNGVITFTQTVNRNDYIGIYNNQIRLEAGKTYTLSADVKSNQFNKFQICIQTLTCPIRNITSNYTNIYTTVNVSTTKNYTILMYGMNGGSTGAQWQLKNLMIVEGSNIPETYSEQFKFGYMVSNNQSNAFTLQFIDNYNNNTYTLTNNSSVYLPFQYINKEITFSYNVNQNVSSDINSNVNITFTPIFSGTLKSNNSNALKSTYTYVYNYIYYKNFKLSPLQNIYLDDMLEINYPTTNKDGQTLTLSSVLTPSNVISGYTSDIKQSNIIDKDIYFNGNDSLYKFNIATYMYTSKNGLIYSINFDSISLGVLNSDSVNSYLDDNGNDLEIYNTCGGLLTDFKCNVSNAITFVIFNIPIIGPVFNFVKSLIIGIESLVDLINSFNGFGIMFSVFVIYMSYCIIRKMYNK